MKEIERQKRVISMLITAHSVLRDRLIWVATFSDILLLLTSIIINVFLFVDAKFIQHMTGLSDDSQKWFVGIASIIVFGLSIILPILKLRENAANHSLAAKRLFPLLHKCREILAIQNTDKLQSIFEEFNREYSQVLNTIVEIPDRKFNQLKLIHYRKIELSKMIDLHPTSMLFILKLKLFFQSFKSKK